MRKTNRILRFCRHCRDRTLQILLSYSVGCILELRLQAANHYELGGMKYFQFVTFVHSVAYPVQSFMQFALNCPYQAHSRVTRILSPHCRRYNGQAFRMWIRDLVSVPARRYDRRTSALGLGRPRTLTSKPLRSRLRPMAVPF